MMGKSPGKWIKTVLFGKKSTRSKGRNASLTGDKGYNSGKGSPTLTVSSPVISGPVLVSIESNGIVPEAEKGTTSISSEVIPLDTSQNLEKQTSVGSTLSNDPERMKEEQAAIKAQAAFRGFLARRAFHALRGIIRLQALVRGHLVRRQAVATLRSMQGIVRLQALVRGQRVRRSGVGLEAFTKFGHTHTADDVPLNNWKDKVATNAFICKLLSSSPAAMPLQVQYDNGESNSVFCWLERWTSSYTWKPLPQPKKASDSKSRTKRGSYAMEMETSKPKRSVRRNSSGGAESGPTVITSEPEKSKRNAKKTSSTPTELPQEHPQTELEKVKRSLRKVSSLMAEVSDRPDAEIEKPNRSVKKVPNTVPQDLPIDESAEKAKNEVSLTPDVKPSVESALETVAAEGEADALLDISPVESYPLQSIDKEENLSGTNGELSPKEDQASHENQKTSKRRTSFSAKTECADNGLQNTPPVPSYMLTTQSAKAKLRGQGSPRLVSESVDRNDYTRRHSLPSSTNGKLSSHSPRTQKLVQANGKGGIKTDRSLLASRDGNEKPEKPMQVEWRR